MRSIAWAIVAMVYRPDATPFTVLATVPEWWLGEIDAKDTDNIARAASSLRYSDDWVKLYKVQPYLQGSMESSTVS